MATHIWSVLCSRGLLDKYTNNISLIDVVEALQIQPAEEVGDGQRGAFPTSMFLVSLWRRSNYSGPERTMARFYIEMPDGETLRVSEMVIDLENHRRSRTLVGISALPVKGPGESGIYEFHVDVMQHKEQWVRVASIPLELTILPAGSQPGVENALLNAN